jgi:hypothetical protein
MSVNILINLEVLCYRCVNTYSELYYCVIFMLSGYSSEDNNYMAFHDIFEACNLRSILWTILE